MKTLFIPAKVDIEIVPLLSKVKLEGKTGILTTVQHLEQVKKIKNKDFIIGGQVLGCNAINANKIKNKVSQFLFIGSGKFHAIQIALETNKPVYILNPFTKEFNKISNEEIQKIKNKIKGSYLKYLNAKKVGIIISTKPGQSHLKQTLKIKTSKPTYYFICNNITNQIENFPDIDVWINTACPRLAYENEFNAVIINLKDLENFKHKSRS